MNTISQDDRDRVNALPVGPNAKQTLLRFMRQGISMDEALLELERIVHSSDADAYRRAATHGRSTATGVR